MASRNKSRIVMKENRIPLGKKRERLQKSNLESNNISEVVSTKNASKPLKKKVEINTSTPLRTINVNDIPTDTSLILPIENPKTKLSTIKELELELEDKPLESMINSVKIVTNDIPKSTKNVDSTILIRELHETSNVDGFNNTVDEMKSAPVPEVVLSPFVCTTRGQKWKPSPLKPPKLSELFNKYDDDNIADIYKKRLDDKTVELQNKVKYWTELLSEYGNNIPQSVIDEIDVVCGQTKLLTTDKFMQMRSLVEEFDNKSGSMPITTTDLDGFWDMLLLQVGKLEGQFSQLAILEQNNWVPIEPIAKKVINKVIKLKKRPEVKSKFADFLKKKNSMEKKTSNDENYDKKDRSDHSGFNEMKLSNNACVISSTPSSSNKKSLTPMLLKTMELSYVARRSGRTPIIVAKPHLSPLKPSLKNPEQMKGIKRKNIHFESLKTSEYVTPENSWNDGNQKKSIQDRVATPHTIKTHKVDNRIAQNNPVSLTIADGAEKTIKSKNIKTKAKKKLEVKMDVSTDEQNIDCTIRRSSRLANKPQKNYKC